MRRILFKKCDFDQLFLTYAQYSDLESQTETSQVAACTTTMDGGENNKGVDTIVNAAYTSSERDLTRDDEQPSMSQQIEQCPHAMEVSVNNPNDIGTVVENPLYVKVQLQTESELLDIKKSQKSSAFIRSEQRGIDSALPVAGQGSSTENQPAFYVEAVQIETDIEPLRSDRKQISASFTVGEERFSVTKNQIYSIVAAQIEEQKLIEAQSNDPKLEDDPENAFRFSFEEKCLSHDSKIGLPLVLVSNEQSATQADVNSIITESIVHVASGELDNQTHVTELELDTVKERRLLIVHSEEQSPDMNQNLSEAEEENGPTNGIVAEFKEQQLDGCDMHGIVAANRVDSNAKANESESETCYSNIDNVEIEMKNVQSSDSKLEGLTQGYTNEMSSSSTSFPTEADNSKSEDLTESYSYEKCSSTLFPTARMIDSSSKEVPTSKYENIEMNVIDESKSEAKEHNEGQQMDANDASELELDHEIKEGEEVEKVSNPEEKLKVNQKILESEVHVGETSSNPPCIPVESEMTASKTSAAMQISLPTHDEKETALPTIQGQYTKIIGSSLTEQGSYTLPTPSGASKATASNFTDSCEYVDIHAYEVIPDILPKQKVLQVHTDPGIDLTMTWLQEHPTLVNKENSSYDDVELADVPALQSSSKQGEDTGEMHSAKTKKFPSVHKMKFKKKLHKLYRHKPTARNTELKVSTVASGEEGISSQRISQTDHSNPMASIQETMSVKQPHVAKFKIKQRLHKHIHRVKDFVSNGSSTDHNDSPPHSETRTRRKHPVHSSTSREVPEKHEAGPPKDIQELEPALMSSKKDSKHSSDSWKISGQVEIAHVSVEHTQSSINKINSMDNLDLCFNGSNTPDPPKKIQVKGETVPIKRKQLTVRRSKSEEKIHEKRGPDSMSKVDFTKYSDDSPSHKKLNPTSYRTMPMKRKQPSIKLMIKSKEELRKEYRHRPPPPKDPLAPTLASCKDLSPDISQSDNSKLEELTQGYANEMSSSSTSFPTEADNSKSEEVTQSYAYEKCSSTVFPIAHVITSSSKYVPTSKYENIEMSVIDESKSEAKEHNEGQKIDANDATELELDHEMKKREEVEKVSNSEEKLKVNQKILEADVHVGETSSDQLCIPVDSEVTASKISVAMQVSLPTHDERESILPTVQGQYTKITGSSLTEQGTYTLPTPSSASKATASNFTDSCEYADIHAYEVIPDIVPKQKVLQVPGVDPTMTWLQGHPTLVNKENSSYYDDVELADVPALQSSSKQGEDTGEMHSAKTKKFPSVHKMKLKKKLHKLYRHKPTARNTELKVSTVASGEEGISSQRISQTDHSNPMASIQETMSVKQPHVAKFKIKQRLHKHIHRVKDFVSNGSSTDHNDSPPHSETRTRRKHPVHSSTSREVPEKHEAGPPKDIQELEPALMSSKKDSEHSSDSWKISGQVEIAHVSVEHTQPSINKINSMDNLDLCFNGSNTPDPPKKIQVKWETVPIKRKQLTVRRSKSEEKIHEKRGPDSMSKVDFTKYSDDSPSHKKLNLSNPTSYRTMPMKRKQPSTKLMIKSKEELRKEYRHRPPPPKDPLAPTLASYKDLSPDISQSDNYEEVCQSPNASTTCGQDDSETMPMPTPNLAKLSASNIKLKEELQKVYRHRTPLPKIPAKRGRNLKKDTGILSDIQQTEAFIISEEDQYHLEHSNTIAKCHKQQESTPDERIKLSVESEKELHTQPSSDSIKPISDTSEDDSKNMINEIHLVDHVMNANQIEPVNEMRHLLPLPTESGSNHLVLASDHDSEGDYMPLIPKRKKKKATSEYETLHF